MIKSVFFFQTYILQSSELSKHYVNSKIMLFESDGLFCTLNHNLEEKANRMIEIYQCNRIYVKLTFV